jgi:hypothetical protein
MLVYGERGKNRIPKRFSEQREEECNSGGFAAELYDDLT